MQLIIHSRGAYLKRAQGMFEVRTEDNKIERFSVDEIDSIFISKGTLVTSDAIMLAIKEGIDIVFMDGQGEAKGRVWNNRFGSIATIRREQLSFSQQARAIPWIKTIIEDKIREQLAFLQQVRYFPNLPNSPTSEQRIDDAILKIQQTAKALQTVKLKKTDESWKNKLRGYEGTASRYYFQAIAYALPHQYRFETRGERPAKDKFNAMLNYGYGMLYAQVQSAQIKSGLDPSIGVLHADQYSSAPTLAFDMIEPYRNWIERVVFRLCMQYAITDNDFRIVEKGGLYLKGEGKKRLIHALHDYLAEVIPRKGLKRSRLHHISLDAQHFANMLLERANGT
ncbi:MAG: CRISPR-associated endonuclease Cas1 [Bernardetiaceae bacterium]|nr:CRISPR-associated endonuclease Cas1 [Bernardetiaceae bacterium]